MRCVGRALLLLVVIFSVSAAMAADPVREPLRIPVFDIPPYGQDDGSGHPSGLYVELTRVIATEAGYTPRIALVPFARMLAQLNAGAADMSISFPTDSTTGTLIALEPIVGVDAIVVPRKGFAASARRDFANRKIGRIRGGCIDMSNSVDAPVELFELNSFTEGLRLLALGRIDGLCLTREVYRYYLQKDHRSASEFGEPVLINHRDAWLFLRADAPSQMQQSLRNAVRTLKRRKVVDGVINRYIH